MSDSGQILWQRPAARPYLGLYPLPECQKPNRASSIEKLDTAAIELNAEITLIHLQRAIKQVITLTVEYEVAEVVMSIYPGSAIVIEHALNVACTWFDGNVVQAEIAMDAENIHWATLYNPSVYRLSK